MNITSFLLKSPYNGAVGRLLPPRSIQQVLVRFESKNKDPYGQQMGGYEYKPETFGATNKWRKSYEERGFWLSNTGLFSSKKFKGDKFMKLNPENFKYLNSVEAWWKYHSKERLLYDQQFSEQRLAILGPELAAAHFTVFRGGAVKFFNRDGWIRDDTKLKNEYDDDLPNCFDSSYILEGIDISHTSILYEGLVNIEKLRKLKWFSASACKHFDDWCLDRISSEYGNTLEHLDLSYTTVSYFGLNALYRFRKLKTLVLDDFSNEVEFFKMCSEIKRIMPGLKIEGISKELLVSDEDGSKLMQSTV